MKCESKNCISYEPPDALLSSAYAGVDKYDGERAEMAEPLQIVPSMSGQLILKST